MVSLAVFPSQVGQRFSAQIAKLTVQRILSLSSGSTELKKSIPEKLTRQDHSSWHLTVNESDFPSPLYILSIFTTKAHQMILNLFFSNRGQVTFFSPGNTVLLTRSYQIYVRPILDYCSIVWNPYHTLDINTIK